MRSTIRSLVLNAAALLALTAQAQPTYMWVVSGTVSNCTPNQEVTLETMQGTLPQQTITATLDSNCAYFAVLYVASTPAYIQASTSCNGQTMGALDSAVFDTFIDTVYTVIDLNCSTGNVDCLGVPGGSALPGTPCNDGDPMTVNDTWDANCTCIGQSGNDQLILTGSVTGCNGSAMIHLLDLGTVPMLDTTFFTDTDCNFVFSYSPTNSLQGMVIIEASCDGGSSWLPQVNSPYSFTGEFTLTYAFDCNNQQLDCLGIPGGPNLPYEPCDDGDPDTNVDMWDDNCNCVGYTVCQACFTWEQDSNGGEPVPFTVNLTNCTVELIPPYTYTWIFPDGTTTTTTDATYTFPGPGQYYISLYASGDSCSASSSQMISASPDGTLSTFPTAGCTACFSALQNLDGGQPVPFNAILNNCSYGGQPVQHLWTLPDGTTSTQAEYVFYTFPGAGTYAICLSIADNDGCTSTFCDSVYVDDDGNVSSFPSTVYDCLGIPNGPNGPGSPCTTPAQGPGTWSVDCECLPNVTLPCEAGFWVIQAYELDSLNNPGGGGQPIPFELWVWNLSTGGSGVYSFVWDFGDGNTSTDPFPTHVYAASGPYTLCLTMTDDSGCEDSYCEDIEVDQDGMLGMAEGPDVRNALTIRMIQELPTGIAEPGSLEAGGLWPNPVADAFTMQLNSSRSGTVELSVVDLNGRVVRTANMALNAGVNMVQVDVEGLDSGIYLLRMSNGHNIANMRFVKH